MQFGQIYINICECSYGPTIYHPVLHFLLKLIEFSFNFFLHVHILSTLWKGFFACESKEDAEIMRTDEEGCNLQRRDKPDQKMSQVGRLLVSKFTMSSKLFSIRILVARVFS